MNEVKEANMPSAVEKIMVNSIFSAVWSWEGMAQVFIKYNNPVDIGEFIACLQIEQQKRK